MLHTEENAAAVVVVEISSRTSVAHLSSVQQVIFNAKRPGAIFLLLSDKTVHNFQIFHVKMLDFFTELLNLHMRL